MKCTGAAAHWLIWFVPYLHLDVSTHVAYEIRIPVRTLDKVSYQSKVRSCSLPVCIAFNMFVLDFFRSAHAPSVKALIDPIGQELKRTELKFVIGLLICIIISLA